jgi:hypothetical protein
MMKMILLILVVSSTTCLKATDLEYLRKNYAKAVNDETLCKTIINKLSVKVESQVHLAYLGAFQTIWANHVFNPVSKMNTFTKGRVAIEMAVQKEPNNAEIRFIRLSVQKNCPAFLGYSSNIASDKKFLKDHLSSITSEQLKKMVQELIES